MGQSASFSTGCAHFSARLRLSPSLRMACMHGEGAKMRARDVGKERIISNSTRKAAHLGPHLVPALAGAPRHRDPMLEVGGEGGPGPVHPIWLLSIWSKQ